MKISDVIIRFPPPTHVLALPMKVLIPILSAVTLVAASSHTDRRHSPVVSLSKVTDLITDSFSLGLDLITFSSNKLEESLTGEPQKIYGKFVHHTTEYRDMVTEWWSTSRVGTTVTAGLGVVASFALQQYQRMNKVSARILDPVVHEFEGRFPSSQGLVGASLGDRLLLIVWLVWLTRTSIRLTGQVLFGCKGCRKSRK